MVHLLLMLLFALGCAKKDYAPMAMAENSPYGGAEDAEGEVMAVAAAVSRAPMRDESAPRPRMPSPAPRAAGAPAPPPPPPPPPPNGAPPAPEAPPATEAPAAARMVHYEGWARLRVDDPEAAVNALAGLAKETGGFVEQSSQSRVTLRVPVAQFEAAFAKALLLGAVVDKSIQAEDVTEAFTSVELRARTARMTRDRLIALLAKANSEEEKLRLLAELQRVSEELDRLEASMKHLSALAALSRITVQLDPRRPIDLRAAGADVAALSWIRQLSPFHRAVAEGGKPLLIDVPPQMIRLDARPHLIAEGADGARLWSSRQDNTPVGDAAFWATAIEQRLGPEFQSVTRGTVGDYTTLRFLDRSDQPYVYVIALRVDGKRLHLVELYLPTLAHEGRYAEAFAQALTGSRA